MPEECLTCPVAELCLKSRNDHERDLALEQHVLNTLEGRLEAAEADYENAAIGLALERVVLESRPESSDEAHKASVNARRYELAVKDHRFHLPLIRHAVHQTREAVAIQQNAYDLAASSFERALGAQTTCPGERFGPGLWTSIAAVAIDGLARRTLAIKNIHDLARTMRCPSAEAHAALRNLP